MGNLNRNMPLEDFLKKEILINAGMSLSGATQLCNNIFHRTSLKTVEDLFQAIKAKENEAGDGYSQNLPGVGLKSSGVLLSIMEQSGFKEV